MVSKVLGDNEIYGSITLTAKKAKGAKGVKGAKGTKKIEQGSIVCACTLYLTQIKGAT